MKYRIEREYNVWDYMKTAAILLVVIGHVTRMYTPYGVLEIGIQPTIIRIITAFIYSFHMPAFFAVSGAVYYNNKIGKNKYNNHREFVINKAKRLLIPYIVFALCWVFPTMLYMGFVNNVFSYFVDSYLLANNPRHLWFLLVLFEIFIIFNMCYNQIKQHRIITLFLLIFLNIIHSHIPGFFQLSNLFGYFIYFYLGFLFVSISDKVDSFISCKSKFWTLVLLPILWVSSYTIAWIFRDNQIAFSPIVFFSAISGSLFLYVLCRMGEAVREPKVM